MIQTSFWLQDIFNIQKALLCSLALVPYFSEIIYYYSLEILYESYIYITSTPHFPSNYSLCSQLPLIFVASYFIIFFFYYYCYTHTHM